MSTYNGEKYLQEQIDSILGQQDVHVHLLVRDDGSTDHTLNILEDYQEKGLLSFYTGGNLGPQRSFLHLLQHAPESDYYAFADQDDVWMDDKLISGIESISAHADRPALYFSQTQLVDENLQPMQSVVIHPFLTFGEMLIYKFIGGCTMVMNHALRTTVGSYIPSNMPMHDLWIYSIAIATDAFIFFDPNPHILYRQHGNNTVGQGQGFVYESSQRLKRFFSQNNERFIQAQELSNGYLQAMSPRNAAILQLFLDGKKSFRKRIAIIKSHELRCANKTTQWLFWLNVIFNKY